MLITNDQLDNYYPHEEIDFEMIDKTVREINTNWVIDLIHVHDRHYIFSSIYDVIKSAIDERESYKIIIETDKIVAESGIWAMRFKKS
jgi:hypothetical protein